MRWIEAFTGWWARRDRKYQDRLDALWQRLGERYWYLHGALLLGGSVALWLVALALAGIWVRITLGQYWSLAGFGSACLLATWSWVSASVLRGPARPIVIWMRAGKPPAAAVAAWRSAVELPMRAMVGIALPRFFAGMVLPLGLFVALALGRPWLVAFAAAFALAGGLFTPLMLHYLILDWYLGPVKRETALAAPPVLAAPRPLSSLRFRVLVVLAVINDGTAVFASMLSSTGRVSLSTILVGQTVGFCIASLIALGLSILATEAIVSPIDALVRAAEAIRAGDLSARVLVTSADELGLLSSRFNTMAGELQASRGRLVSAREEERRRVRRDLHDGPGSTLGALVMQLGLARDLVDADPARARLVLGELETLAQDAIVDIRRLVYELRPPSLDQLGLVGAVREEAARLCSGGPIAVQLSVPGSLPVLPAAVEVAAFRIVQEALTNLVRHSGAETGSVEIALLDGSLGVTVCDDGLGILPEPRAGVGLGSMRDRAFELGGTCTVEPEGGTVVRAQLPLPALPAAPAPAAEVGV